MQYPDGWAIWSLHGVRVPEWLAVTPSGQLDPIRIHEIENAEVRKEFVRKVGLERLLRGLNARLVHSSSVCLRTPECERWPTTYHLYELDYGHDTRRRVLRMDNPSLPGVEHVEYVPMECDTVEQAMNARLNRDESDVDDEAGDEWFLHGDVVVVPEGSSKVKRWPSLIA
jgi:hypothetical protein